MPFKKIVVRKARRHSTTATEILDRLDRYVANSGTEAIRLLVTHWQDQQDALSYSEIRRAILADEVPQDWLNDWFHDYSLFVTEKMVPVWGDAMKSGSFGQPVMDKLHDAFKLDLTTGHVLDWIDERGASFITSITEEQTVAVRSLLHKYAYEKYSTEELAKVIRPCIGLTDAQSRAVTRFYDTVKANLMEQHPRTSKEKLVRQAEEKAMRYAERLHRQRAFTIAQTELSEAYNKGQHESVRQAIEQGLMGTVIERWITSGAENVCGDCDAMNGTEVPFDQPFDFGKHRVLHVGADHTPPLHPRCACALEYIEIEPPARR